MKHLYLLPALSLCLWVCLSVTAAQGNWHDFSAQGYVVTDRGQNFCAWSRTTLHTNAQGALALRTNTLVHLSPGRHYLQNGAWVDSTPELVVSNNAVLGRGAPCTARFAANLNTSGATELTTAAGTLKLQALGLVYQDTASGSNVWVGVVKDSPAEIVGKSQVWYRDAFSGISADLILDFRASGVSQDVALRARPPSPEQWGLNPASTHLIVVSEIVDGPAPRLETRSWPAGREIMRDQTADFGGLRMIPGKAFQAGDPKHRGAIAVAKQFETVGNRRLIQP